MATRTDKNQQIETLVEEIKGSNVLYIADTSELSAEATSNLRRQCHKSGVRMLVVKNTLLKQAMDRVEGRDYSGLAGVLKGHSSLLFAEKGNTPAKLIKEFRKKNPKPVLKGAWIDEAVFIGDDQVAVLSDLKGKEELIGDIIALLQSPIKNVVSGLQGSAGHKIAGLVKALEERAA